MQTQNTIEGCLKIDCNYIVILRIYICSYNRLPKLFNFEGVIFDLVVIKNNFMGSGHFVSVRNFRYSNKTRINEIFEVKWMIWSTRTKRGSIIYLLSISSLSKLRSQATHHFYCDWKGTTSLTLYVVSEPIYYIVCDLRANILHFMWSVNQYLTLSVVP
jgi:hypothetical protein